MMKSSEFMAALPGAVQSHLPQGPLLHRGRLWPWGVQIYVDDPRYHYEVARVPERLGNRLELGLHFESRAPVENRAMLTGFAPHLLPIKAELGLGFEAEPWDRGWAKVYETLPLESYSWKYLQQVARRLAEIVSFLHPIYRSLQR